MKRLADRIRDVLEPDDRSSDRGAELLLTKALARGTAKRVGGSLALLRQIEAVVALAVVPEGCTSRTAKFVANCLPQIRVLAKLDVENLVPPVRSRWPDPALTALVARVEPMWRQVTGRTALPTSEDKEGDSKTHRFADWLGELLESAGLPRPPIGRIVDIVRFLKAKKTGTRHPKRHFE
jgi:hypothetical protein